MELNNMIQVPYTPKEKHKLSLNQQYQEAIKNYPIPQPQIIQNPNLIASFGVDPNEFMNQFKNMDNMTDQELYNLVASSYNIVLSYAKQNSDYMAISVVWTLFNNPRYISTLVNVFGNVQLDVDQIICCNRIIYDYTTLQNNNSNAIVKISINSLAQIVNKPIIDNLSSINILSRDELAMVAVCANSSQIQLINVKRLNLYFINSNDENKYNVFTIVSIYQELFYNCVTQLTEGIMFDAWSKEELNNLSEAQQNIYYTINEALLCLLEQAPSQVIYQVLKSYCTDYYNNGNGMYRFSMVLSGDYPRINEIISLLEKENIYLP